MTRPEDAVIDRVSWHTRVIDNPETPERVKRRFQALVTFLQDNGLVVRTLLGPGEEAGEDFALRRGDLTDEGFSLMKTAYDRWLRAFDKTEGRDPENLRVLANALKRLRQAKA